MSPPPKRSYWLTPPELYDQLNQRFKFDFDPCPHPMPDWDGLTVPWGKSNFVNPPHGDGKGGVLPWVRKALAEHEKGNQSLLLIPVAPGMYDLLRAGPWVTPLDPFEWVSPDGRSRSPARHTVAFTLPGKTPEINPLACPPDCDAEHRNVEEP